MHKNNRRFALALSVVVSAIAGCGPWQNPLGVAGTYSGLMEAVLDGKVEVTNTGGDRVEIDHSHEIKQDVAYVIDPGVGADAAVTGGFVNCALDLNIEGNELVLVDTVECVDDTDDDATSAGSTNTASNTQKTKISKFTVTKAGDGAVEIAAEGTATQEEHAMDGTQTSADYEFTLTFDGTLVGR